MTDTKSLRELADGALEMVEVDGDGCYFSGALVTELAAAIIALLDENAALIKEREIDAAMWKVQRGVQAKLEAENAAITAQLDEYDLKNRILVKDFNTLTTENRALAAQNQRAEARIADDQAQLAQLLPDIIKAGIERWIEVRLQQLAGKLPSATDDAAAGSVRRRWGG